MSEEKPKIIIDEDWKSQVEAEKEAAQAQPDQSVTAEGAAAPARNDDPPLPEASFSLLISSLASEAMIALGQLPHPATGQLMPSKNQAKYLIDTIAMLREKTLGNVPAEESTGVETLLHQLRMAFLQMPASSPPPAAGESQ